MSLVFRWRRRIWKGLRTALAIYLGLLVMLAVLQRKFVFFPTRADEASMLESAKRLKLVPWRNSESEIIGWRAPWNDCLPANRLLVFHGNAGSAIMRNYIRAGFERLGNGRVWDVVLFEYPGYGARGGFPSEATINAAAREAFEQLVSEDDRPIYVAGESIGSGPASHLAGAYPGKVSGVYLITPFSSLTDVAAYHYPFLPVRLIMQDRFDNVEALAKYRGPLAVLLAGRDRIVPASLGRHLFEGYRGPKLMEILTEADHNEIDFSPHAGWWRSVSSFLLATP